MLRSFVDKMVVKRSRGRKGANSTKEYTYLYLSLARGRARICAMYERGITPPMSTIDRIGTTGKRGALITAPWVEVRHVSMAAAGERS